jgi:hypothetical protein
VVVTRLWPLPALVAVTLAPAIAAPEESVTVPAKAPVPAVWADINTGERSKARTTKTAHAIRILMDHPIPATFLACQFLPVLAFKCDFLVA